MTSPTQRTLSYLRELGWPVVQVVERYIPQSKTHIDLFGFGDIAALHPEHGLLIVQVTSGSNVSARKKKMLETPEIAEAVKLAIGVPGVAVEIHGWRKIKVCTKCGLPKRARLEDRCTCGHDGARVMWRPQIIKITDNDF